MHEGQRTVQREERQRDSAETIDRSDSMGAQLAVSPWPVVIVCAATQTNAAASPATTIQAPSSQCSSEPAASPERVSATRLPLGDARSPVAFAVRLEPATSDPQIPHANNPPEQEPVATEVHTKGEPCDPTCSSDVPGDSAPRSPSASPVRLARPQSPIATVGAAPEQQHGEDIEDQCGPRQRTQEPQVTPSHQEEERPARTLNQVHPVQSKQPNAVSPDANATSTSTPNAATSRGATLPGHGQSSSKSVHPSSPEHTQVAPTDEGPRQVKEIRVEVRQPEGQKIHLRFVDRGQDVVVTTRVTQPGSAIRLRAGLDELAASLDQQGYRTEVWRPAGPADGGSLPIELPAGPGTEERAPSIDETSKDVQSQFTGEGRQPDSRRRAMPAWLDQIENQLDGGATSPSHGGGRR